MSTLIDPALLPIIGLIVAIIGIIVVVIIALMSFQNTRQSADRVMLVKDIYKPLYTDMKHISNRLINYHKLLGSSSLWDALSNSGMIYKIPSRIRRSVDNFYKALFDYHGLRAAAIRIIENNARQEIANIRKGRPAPDEPSKYEHNVYEPERILAQSEPIPFQLNPSAHAVVFSSSSSSPGIGLMRSELATVDLTALIRRLHDRANQNADIQRVRVLNHQLQKDLPKLLDNIQNRISNPTPLSDPIIGLIRRG